MKCWIAAGCIILSTFSSSYCDNCNLSTLEEALYAADSNRASLNDAFFPPRQQTSRYFRVHYTFSDTTDNCSVTYIWSVGGFLLIQPPTIFQFTSLFINFLANDLTDIKLTLPGECRTLVGENCSCKDLHQSKDLNILTQHILQYSKFSSPENVVRDTSSGAQAVCTELLQEEYFNSPTRLYLSITVIGPLLLYILFLLLIRKNHKWIEKIIVDPSNHHHLVGFVLAGFYVALYVFALDISAIVFNENHNVEYVECTNCRDSNLILQVFTLFSEVAVTGVYFLLIGLCARYRKILVLIGYACTDGIFKDKSRLSKAKVSWALLGFLCIPFYCLLSHLSYFLVSWLTEPTKTTSVFFLAALVCFYLYISIRTSYQIFKTIKGDTNTFNKIGLVMTFLCSFPLAGSVAYIISSLYLVPLPTNPLGNYIENLVQIILVFLGALITYKIVSFEPTDSSKILKGFKEKYECEIVQLQAVAKMPQHVDFNQAIECHCEKIHIDSFAEALQIIPLNIELLKNTDSEIFNVKSQNLNLVEISISEIFADSKRLKAIKPGDNSFLGVDDTDIPWAEAELTIPISKVYLLPNCIVMSLCGNNRKNYANVLLPPFVTNVEIRKTYNYSHITVKVSLYNSDGDDTIIFEDQKNEPITLSFKNCNGDDVHQILLLGKKRCRLQSVPFTLSNSGLSINDGDLMLNENYFVINLFPHNRIFADHGNPAKAYFIQKELEDSIESTGRILGKIAHRMTH